MPPRPSRVDTASSILIVEHGRLPSTDYFLLAQADSFGVPVRVVDSVCAQPTPQLFMAGTLVVFVRYLDKAWVTAVLAAQRAGRLAGIVYFIDDDLLDSSAWPATPKPYAQKLAQLTAQVKWLQRHQVALWVASRHLAAKYRFLEPVLIEAKPAATLYARQPVTRIFYHGTAAHLDEIRWLVPVIRQLQERCADTTFEIFGDLTVNRLYREIPRVSVLHPMNWQNYRDYCARADLHIGLAPLLDNPFNAARSITKFFDMVRCGAVGIYSDREPFASFIVDGTDGLLAANDPALWIEHIVTLAEHAELRTRLAENARRRALHISSGHA